MSLKPSRSSAKIDAARATVGPARAGITQGSALTYLGGGLVIGGTVETLPPEYTRTIDDLLVQIGEECWQRWWATAGQPACSVYSWIGGPRTLVRVRRSASSVYAARERAIATDDPRRFSDPGAPAAQADANALIAKLRDRFNLLAPPDFRDAPRGLVEQTR